MDITYNKDESVTIHATSIEYSVIAAAIAQMYNTTLNRPENSFYKSIMDDINEAYNEQALPHESEG